MGGGTTKELVIYDNKPLCHCCQLSYTQEPQFAVCSVPTNTQSLAMTAQKNEAAGDILNLLTNIHASRITYIYIFHKEGKINTFYNIPPKLKSSQGTKYNFSVKNTVKDSFFADELGCTDLGRKSHPCCWPWVLRRHLFLTTAATRKADIWF